MKITGYHAESGLAARAVRCPGIIEARRAIGVSVAALCELIGISEIDYWDYAFGKEIPIETRVKLADVIDKGPDPKDPAAELAAAAKRILTELLNDEFKDIRQNRFSIIMRKPTRGGLGAAGKGEAGRVFIFISPDVHPDALRPLLRHECLHVLTGFADDQDPAFIREAVRRGIDQCA
jgi:hypothetical protein